MPASFDMSPVATCVAHGPCLITLNQTALLEAMSAGLAIVTTSGTGCAEVVGKAPILVHSRNSERIRDAIERLAAQPVSCDELRRAVRARVHNAFAWRATAEQYVENCELATRATQPGALPCTSA